MAYFGHICFPLGPIMITPWAKNTVFSLFFAHEGEMPFIFCPQK